MKLGLHIIVVFLFANVLIGKEVESPIVVLPFNVWAMQSSTSTATPYGNAQVYNPNQVSSFTTQMVDYHPVNPWHDPFICTEIENKIWLEINPYDGIPIDFPFEVSVTVNIRHFLFPSGSFTDKEHTFKVNYNPSSHTEFKKIDLLKLTGGEKVVVTIVNFLPPKVAFGTNLQNLYSKILLKAQTKDKRYYLKSVFQPIPCSDISLQNTGPSKVMLSWTPMPHAEEYDIEYSFYDNYNAMPVSSPDYYNPFSTTSGSINNQFFNNACRVTVKESAVELPIVNENTTYSFRVRAVGRQGEDFENRFETPWSCEKTFQNQAHVADDLNYQTITSFAEEGKYKVINEYFDGRMASRQKVTALQSNGYALVQESIYDGIGRKAIEVLPGAVLDGALTFYPGFNRNLGGQPYGPSDFETTGLCARPPDPMSTLYGTSRYYSPEFYNSLTALQKESELKLIPDAFGYPFTQTRFMNDNTNRPIAQGGVGRDHIIDRGHETKISYVDPTQSELDRLFGTEVGFARNYKKIVTQDPNGQISFAYQDLKGNTIATSLYGAVANLDTLETYQKVVFQDDLVPSGVRSVDNKSINTQQVFFVGEDNQTYQFNYEVASAAFRDATCTLSSICYDCVYDAKVALINTDCNDTIFYETQTIGPLNNINQICEGASWRSALSSTLLKKGNYLVKVQLTVNAAAALAYIDDYINDPDNACVEHLTDFEDYYLSQIPDEPCVYDCEAYQSRIEDLQIQIAKTRGLIENNPFGTDNSYLLDRIAQLNEQIEELREMCDGQTLNVCEINRQRMLADMSPNGQYAMLTVDAGQLIGDGQLSIFSINNLLGPNGSTINYKDNRFSYPYNNNGVMTNLDPNSMPLSTLVNNYWQDEWAEQFLPYHPEYCYLQMCDEASAIFDLKLLGISTAAQAIAEGLITSNGLGNPLLNMDPSWNSGGLLQGLKPSMETEMNNFFVNYPAGTPTMSLYELAKNQTCQASGQNMASCLASLSFSSSNSAMADALWLTYRSLYLSLKQKYEYRERTRRAIAQGCYNGCIGIEPDSIPAERDDFHLASNQQLCNSYGDLMAERSKVFVGPYDLPGMGGIVDFYDPTQLELNINHMLSWLTDTINAMPGCSVSVPDSSGTSGTGSACLPYACMEALPAFFLQLIDTLPNGSIRFMELKNTPVEPPSCFRTSPFIDYFWKKSFSITPQICSPFLWAATVQTLMPVI